MLGRVFSRQFLKDLYQEINEDNIFNGAAALAYYLTLAIFPAFIVLMSVLPYLPIRDIDQAIMDMVGQALPQEAYALVEGVVTEVTQERRGGLLSFGLLATLWTASSGMYAVMQQLNITYDITEERNFFKVRAVALLLSIAFGALIISAFSLIVLGGILEEWIANAFGQFALIVVAFRIFRWVVIVMALLLGFALIYRFGPNAEQKFRFITPGSIFGTILLGAASVGFSFYIANFANYDATYGSIGAVIILMLWFYIAGLVILVGSEINALLEHYSPKGKVKGEKTESEQPGQPLHPDQGASAS